LLILLFFRDGGSDGNCHLPAHDPHQRRHFEKAHRMSEPANRPPEPEIIPPGAPLPRGARVWVSSDTGGTQRIYVKPIGPVGLALLTLGVGVGAAFLIVFLLGAAVFGLAAVGVLTLVGIIAGLLRGPARPLR
jgi:hypothetical protein